MPFQITATYAALLALHFIALSVLVIVGRARMGVSNGDGGNAELAARIRRHGNAAEYVPFALLLLALAEAGGMGAPWVHVSGALLLAARLVHPFGLGAAGGAFPARVFGSLATFAAILVPVGFTLFTVAGVI